MTAAHREAGILSALCRVAMAHRVVMAQEAARITMSTVHPAKVRRAAIMARAAMVHLRVVVAHKAITDKVDMALRVEARKAAMAAREATATATIAAA